ncbi:MAG: coproporphyrinogen dehydrogenase HemZ [Eubacteriales bacterium]|nr:coproporphyrinogen dehydrogenase HemZ [Eubacteriales bacterium]
MHIVFKTEFSSFIKETLEMLSLFYKDFEYSANTEDKADITVVHEESVVDGTRYINVSLYNGAVYKSESFEKIYKDTIIEKRMHKRQFKLCLYDCLVKATGYRPPWGSLTGIRPTGLVYKKMREGAEFNEALKWFQNRFDVSPDKTVLVKEIIAEQQKYAAANSNEIDIYVGVPFCVSRCRYCSFFSDAANNAPLMEKYTDCLIKEISAVLPELKSYKLRSFYMGGGTPTALNKEQLKRILYALKPVLEKVKEISIEAGRPDTIDIDKLKLFKSFGVNRISINPQTKHETTLDIIGRSHSSVETENAFNLARSLGFDNINMDIIAGLPGENEAMFLDTLKWVSGMNPESITIHTLSIKRASLMHQWKDSLPQNQVVESMVDMGREFCVKNNLKPYYLYRQKRQAGNLENTGYAKPNKACIYNIDSMEEMCSIIALGAGGISKIIDLDSDKIIRSANMMDARRYIERIDLMIDKKKELIRRFAPVR